MLSSFFSCCIPCTSYFDFFDRALSAASKRPENILLKRPSVARASSSQDVLVELNSDAVIRGKNSASAVPAEGIIMRLSSFLCAFS